MHPTEKQTSGSKGTVMSRIAKLTRSDFQGTHVRVTSVRIFSEVAETLKASMGSATVPQIVELAAEVSDEIEFERLIRDRFVGSSGLMLFAELDHGAWISIYGIQRRTVRLVLGNPVIAITMIREDVSAGLFVPVELLLTEADDASGCMIDYVLPSSLIASNADNPQLRAAALVLDQKLAALVAAATGLET
jgi:uncharacterized protein (DUF302 family)